MRKKIISNLLSSGIEKLVIMGVQFISSIMLIRLLPRDDYGIIGIVAGYFAFVNIVNISLESIIFKDHKKFDDRIKEVMQDFFMFNIYKSILFIFIASILSFALPFFYKNNSFIYAIWSITFITIADSSTAPFIIYFASKFNQRLVAKISIFRAILGFLILFGLFTYPYLWYVALKDLIVSTFFVALWGYMAFKKLEFKLAFRTPNFGFIKESFITYALWTHLNGVVTNFIYKSDTLFLSLFVSLAMVGNYNIALNSANIANIVPSILGYQNAVAISNATDNEHAFRISNAFIRLSFFIGILTFAGFYFLGNHYLYAITGVKDNPEIFFYMMCIVSSLVIVKTFASPLVSYITVFGSVKKMVFHISLPLGILTFFSYFINGYLFQAKGIALSNILIAIFWLLLLVIRLEMTQKNLTKNLIWRTG